jgi:hypothetical protein
LYLAIIASQITYIVLFYASFAYFFTFCRLGKIFALYFGSLFRYFCHLLGYFSFTYRKLYLLPSPY